MVELTLVDSPSVTVAPRLRGSPTVRALRRPGVVLSTLVVVTVVAWAVLPGIFTSSDPLVGVPAQRLQGPSLNHLFGTDQLGRDLFSRVVYGSSLSLLATLTAVAVALVFGSTLGLVAGFLGGWIDDVVMRVVDVLLAIPGLLLSLALVTALGFGTVNVAIAVGVATAANFARVMRSEVIKTRQATFVEASFLLGGSRWHILLRHVLPNASRSVFPLAVLQFGLSILVIASLAFLGYGDPPPASDWGLLISIGKDYLKWPWLVYAPAFVTIGTVLSINRISRWLRKTD